MSDVDAQTFARAAAGDEDAFTGLLKAYGPQVCRRLSISSTWQAAIDVDDVMQVTFMEAFLRVSKLEGFDEPSFLAWLTRIARNNLNDAIKELESEKRPDPRKRVQPVSAEDSFVALAELLGTTSGTPSSIVGKSESRRILEDAIGRLPRPYEHAVRMCDLEHRSTAEVAAAMGRSVGAVKMLRLRAHDCLRDLLGTPSRFLSTR